MSHIIKESANGYQVLESRDLLMTNRKVFLASEVTRESSAEIIADLMALDEADSTSEITLIITDSPGGSVSAGLAIFDTIQHIKAPVNTMCLGCAASMGAIIFLGGTGRRSIFPNASIMIHDPSYSGGDIGGKKPHEIQKQIDELNITKSILAGIISDVTGKSLDEVYETTKDDSYFDAKKAVEWGIATDIVGSNHHKAASKNKNNTKGDLNHGKSK